MLIWTIAKREIKLGFRNPWFYTFLVLFTVFNYLLVSVQISGGFLEKGYSHTTGTALNLILYLLPLTTLLLGALSLASDKEGEWVLLRTYPLSSYTFLCGKYVGIAVVLSTLIFFSYGVAGLTAAWSGQPLSTSSLVTFLLFSFGILFPYLTLAFLAGTLSRNRWQALAFGVGIWFFTVLAWPMFLISVLAWFRYPVIQPTLEVLTLFNPAEWVRIFTVMKLGGGSIFGPDYYEWIKWVESPHSTVFFVLFMLVWVSIPFGLAALLWERERSRG